MKKKERLDVLLVARGLAETRARAQALVLAGKVKVDGAPAGKPGNRVPVDVALEVPDVAQPVGRGHSKLAGALERLGLEVEGRVALDAGSSTGGFTEALLERGAARVYAVDVGYGQLAWKLRQDPRVEVRERTNLRVVDPGSFDPRPAVLAMDVSFISVLKLLENLARILAPGSSGLVLVKPQFEAGKARIDKGGIVRDPAVHRAVLGEVAEGFADQGWELLGACPSPIQGAKGNREFFFKVRTPGGTRAAAPAQSRHAGQAASFDDQLAASVEEAHGVPPPYEVG